jgi:site-specific recombinase XerD
MRHIPLNSTALAAFQLLFLRSCGEGPVFVNTHGMALKGYKHWFERAVRSAKIKDFTWYCLRHTFASRLVMEGVDLRTVAELEREVARRAHRGRESQADPRDRGWLALAPKG